MTTLCRSGGAASAVLAGLLTVLVPSAVAADGPFAALSGSWSGGGQMRFSGGNTEALKCRAYYTTKETGSSMGLAIRCASTSNKIELRANLQYAVGGSVTGSWEERTFNTTGDVTGQASASRINLSIKGGGFSGSMLVGTTGSTQSVTIHTEGITLKSVNINLSKG